MARRYVKSSLEGFSPSEERVVSPSSASDLPGSCRVGFSTFHHFHEGREITQVKSSDDQVTTGYTHLGLPFLIVADGYYGMDEKGQEKLKDLNDQLCSLIPSYADALQSGYLPTVTTMKGLFEEIIKLREAYPEHQGRPDFTLSLAITYQKNGKNYCAGFGIGDTGIVLQHGDQVSQLAVDTAVNDTKEGFDCDVSGSAETVWAHNSVFCDREIEAGDTLLGYTFLFDLTRIAALNSEIDKPASLVRSETGDDITRRTLQVPDFKSAEGSLLDYVVKKNQTDAAYYQAKAKENKLSAKAGDDCAMATVVIPTPALQAKLAINVRLNDYKEEREADPRDYFHCGARYFRGFSRIQKLAAAAALENVLIAGADVSTLVEHEKVLNQGRLGKIYRDALKVIDKPASAPSAVPKTN
ncbi:MAG: deAMPylase SidD family protein [Gammaproteobacteria bacterium]|nr:deAMPylase SidD family protein [Gammaproteobacteria bacterium]